MRATKMKIGKHSGRTYAELLNHEPGYVQWVLWQQNPSGELNQFIRYLNAQGFSRDSYLTPAEREKAKNFEMRKQMEAGGGMEGSDPCAEAAKRDSAEGQKDRADAMDVKRQRTNPGVASLSHQYQS
eukprot:gnl/TRDRNA2_/TRDRNA2_169463_c1_seq11.p2 gnl/TRDRNA2_/TRDRNA2_169463_c1~~gnl/TRDRNA2_/TRDRNA2_169463_c1_seq11.p2  ORF type:complete len:127 (+),score=18.58 gnl/TRDRNA2_/TRDRNA2_169463_c1_seq11:18-398(+)